ncbi:peptide-binding protein [Leptospira kobayashii]|uniref:Peptide-binding protein n=1 Tax=Leptospira kobayashii TaxID=1917830 RepID=A0ABN6KMN5_9LEPT|nr:DUF5982 domain-containing protein [Leptospira kobayashii]BDA80070.1 peptide-binding protein [Leptospira kobayashii]
MNLSLFRKFLFLCILISTVALSAQEKPESEQAPTIRPARADLPFEISEKKRLSERDLKIKKEGGYITGLPLLNSDPNNGIGYGVRVFYYYNGERSRPLFEYTPYKYRVFVQYFTTTKSNQYQDLSFDAPYIFDTKWRVRSDLIYEKNPNLLYFGMGTETLKPLSYLERNDPSGRQIRNAGFSDYSDSLMYRRPGGSGEQYNTVTDNKYNRYELENPNWTFSGEYSFFGGTVRTIAGARISRQIIRTYDGKWQDAKFGGYDQLAGLPLNILAPNEEISTPEGTTKVTEENKAGNIIGFKGGNVNTGRIAIVYDTRDFEPDPNRGVFLEATHERSLRAIGSDFQFNKNYVSARGFVSPVEWFTKKPHVLLEKLVLGAKGAMVQTNGDAPFYEMRNMWGTEVTQSGLGGRTTLRGYKQDRFIGQTMAYANFEVRWKFASIDVAKQHFDFQLVPFYDVGRVWDATEKVNLKGYKHSRGLGFRIPWNQATVIIIDHAWSSEDSQTFVNFNHIF